jgi:hypothetical protein
MEKETVQPARGASASARGASARGANVSALSSSRFERVGRSGDGPRSKKPNTISDAASVAAQSVVTEKTSHVLSSSASASSSSQQQQVTKGQKMMSKKMKQQLASTFEMPNEPLSPNEPLIALEALEIEARRISFY